MKVEVVVTCVGFADILAHTLPLNKAMFHQLVVVTSHMDTYTQRVCEYHHVKCIPTDKLQSHLGKFSKGSGINEGLAALDRDAWILHMDADIVCPPLTREVLVRAAVDEEAIYGCDRFMVPNYSAWAEFVARPQLLHENGSWMHMSAFPLGVRVAIDAFGGYIPIGYFQLWHAKSGQTKYPEGHGTAAREDVAFPLLWPRPKRQFIPDLVVYHLESEKVPMGANWNGRKTAAFTLDGQHQMFPKDASGGQAKPQPKPDPENGADY